MTVSERKKISSSRVKKDKNTEWKRGKIDAKKVKKKEIKNGWKEEKVR